MARVIFYEKPGCGGNARQKALLRASGHQLDGRSLLTEPWTAARLRPFFGRKPLEQWFNPASPRVRSGEVSAAELTQEAALLLMLEDPLLIRRPLMQVGDRREFGFDQAEVDAWIGLRKPNSPVTDTCLRLAGTCEPPSRVELQGSRIATLQGGARTAIQDLLGEFATRAIRQGYKVAGVVELAPPPMSNKSVLLRGARRLRRRNFPYRPGSRTGLDGLQSRSRRACTSLSRGRMRHRARCRSRHSQQVRQAGSAAARLDRCVPRGVRGPASDPDIRLTKAVPGLG